MLFQNCKQIIFFENLPVLGMTARPLCNDHVLIVIYDCQLCVPVPATAAAANAAAAQAQQQLEREQYEVRERYEADATRLRQEFAAQQREKEELRDDMTRLREHYEREMRQLAADAEAKAAAVDANNNGAWVLLTKRFVVRSFFGNVALDNGVLNKCG